MTPDHYPVSRNFCAILRSLVWVGVGVAAAVALIASLVMAIESHGWPAMAAGLVMALCFGIVGALVHLLVTAVLALLDIANASRATAEVALESRAQARART